MTTENGNSNRPRTGKGMGLGRFAELAAAYGADFDRWPDAERFRALALAGGSEEARALLADAHELDAALDRLDPPPPPPAALAARVAALRSDDAPSVPFFSPLAAAAGRATVFAMAAAAGLYLGLSLAPAWTGGSDLGLVEASLIAGEAPSIAVVDLLELD